MRDVPRSIDDAFYGGKRSVEMPFAINDAVQVTEAEHMGSTGAVISVESMSPQVVVLVELGASGETVQLPVSRLRLLTGGAV